MKRSLESKAESFALSEISILARRPDPNEIGDRTYSLEITLRVNEFSELLVLSTLSRAVSDEEVTRLGPKSFTRDHFGTAWATLDNPDVDDLATRLVEAIDYDIYRWIVATAVRFVVYVADFTNTGPDPTYDYLSTLLKQAIQTDLTSSQALSVVQTDTGAVRPNYTLSGTFAVVDGMLRIDVTSIKHPHQRVLISRHDVLDTIALTDISRSVSQLGRQMRWAMENDFRQERATLAVVGIPEARPFASGSGADEDVAITREIVRALGRKLRLLTTTSDTASPLLDLTVNAVAVTFENGDPVDPLELLVDYDSDYLLLLSYRDLGDRVRLIVDLSFFASDHPATRLLIQESEVDLTDVDEALDSAVISLTRRLEAYGLTSRAVADTAAAKSVRQTISHIKAHTTVRTRQIGLRFGGILARHNSDLFFDTNVGHYFELYYSVMLPFFSPQMRGGMFDLGFEALMGIDMGEDRWLSGAFVHTVLINLKTYLSRWRYSSTKVNVAVGAGVGVIGLTYNFSPGDRRFAGDEDFSDTEYVAALDFFAQLEAPLFGGWEGDLTVRYIPPTKRLTKFRNAHEQGVDLVSDLSGSLGGVYAVAGIKYRF